MSFLKKLKLLIEERLQSLGKLGIVIGFFVFSDAAAAALGATNISRREKLVILLGSTLSGTLIWVIFFSLGSSILNIETTSLGTPWSMVLVGLLPSGFGSIIRQAALAAMSTLPLPSLFVYLPFYMAGVWTRTLAIEFFGHKIAQFVRWLKKNKK